MRLEPYIVAALFTHLPYVDLQGSSSEEEAFHTPEGRSPKPQPKFENKEPSPEPPDMTGAPRRMSLGQPMHPPEGEILTLQKPTLMHPAVAVIRDCELVSFPCLHSAFSFTLLKLGKVVTCRMYTEFYGG